MSRTGVLLCPVHFLIAQHACALACCHEAVSHCWQLLSLLNMDIAQLLRPLNVDIALKVL